MKTHPIAARFLNKTTGVNFCIPTEAKIIQANGGWWFFEVEHNGETLFSEHGEKTKSGLLETAANDVMEFVL
jgi:hypothetical protein